MPTAISGARVVDDGRVLDPGTVVVVDGGTITAVGTGVPAGADVLDASGATLLPGLIDAHVHTSEPCLATALTFGVTTELEMQGVHTAHHRRHVSDDDAVADVRSSGFGITPHGGHPEELFIGLERPDGGRPGAGGARGSSGAPDRPGAARELVRPFCSTPEEAEGFVARLAADGSDYIKLMIDDGSVEGHPGLPVLDAPTLAAAVAAARQHGLLTVAHVLTIEATATAVEAGVDGLAHLFMDAPHTAEIIDLVAGSGAFVVPCVVLDASMMGITGAELADDPRVASRLDERWLATLRSSYDRYPRGRLDDVLASVAALHAAGVDLLVGTDASPLALPAFGGVVHGASVHHEMQMLVRAGLTPPEVIAAATSTTARRFGLEDRGRVRVGARADLLLVDGDPTTDITATLSARQVWRRGTPLLPA